MRRGTGIEGSTGQHKLPNRADAAEGPATNWRGHLAGKRGAVDPGDSGVGFGFAGISAVPDDQNVAVPRLNPSRVAAGGKDTGDDQVVGRRSILNVDLREGFVELKITGKGRALCS